MGPLLQVLVMPVTKILYVNTPVNPHRLRRTTQSDARAAAELAERACLPPVSDESLSHFVSGGRRHISPAGGAGRPALRSVLVGSFSKACAMPGMRVGATRPCLPKLLGQVSALLEWSVLSVSLPAQAAALAALTGLARLG